MRGWKRIQNVLAKKCQIWWKPKSTDPRSSTNPKQDKHKDSHTKEHIMVKLLKNSDEGNLLKTTRGKKAHYLSAEGQIKETTNFSKEPVKPRRLPTKIPCREVRPWSWAGVNAGPALFWRALRWTRTVKFLQWYVWLLFPKWSYFFCYR